MWQARLQANFLHQLGFCVGSNDSNPWPHTCRISLFPEPSLYSHDNLTGYEYSLSEIWVDICLYIMINTGLGPKSKLSVLLHFMHTLYTNSKHNFCNILTVIYDMKSEVDFSTGNNISAFKWVSALKYSILGFHIRDSYPSNREGKRVEEEEEQQWEMGLQ